MLLRPFHKQSQMNRHIVNHVACTTRVLWTTILSACIRHVQIRKMTTGRMICPKLMSVWRNWNDLVKDNRPSRHFVRWYPVSQAVEWISTTKIDFHICQTRHNEIYILVYIFITRVNLFYLVWQPRQLILQRRVFKHFVEESICTLK